MVSTVCLFSFPLDSAQAQKQQRRVKIDRSKVTREIAVEDEPRSLHTFVEKHGRITSIGLAGDTGQFVHTTEGLLDQVLYENGYTDYYTYSDNEYIIEVTREDDEGVIESIFTFDFIRGTGAKWDAQTDTTIRKVFEIDAQFYERLIFTQFKRQKQDTQAKGGIGPVGFIFLGVKDCVCQYGNNSFCEGQTKGSCSGNMGCAFNGRPNDCVWRGGMF